MKSLEKKLRETLREGILVTHEMHPFARQMLKHLKQSPKNAPVRYPSA